MFLIYLEKQVMLHLSLADITFTVSDFTGYSKIKLLSHRKVKEYYYCLRAIPQIFLHKEKVSTF